jgi:uroporphyrinogen-III synthase
VLSTGVGVTALFAEARALGRDAALRELLVRATIVARGPKPIAALQREGIRVAPRVAEPYTTDDLLRALEGVDLRRAVGVLHYGEANEPLVERLAARGATVHELLLYAWRLPEDTGPLRALARDIVSLAGIIGAAALASIIGRVAPI